MTTAPFSPSPSSNPEDAILLNNNLYSSFCNREVDRGRDRERGGKKNRERESVGRESAKKYNVSQGGKIYVLIKIGDLGRKILTQDYKGMG